MTTGSESPAPKFWKTALLLLGSAAFGGLAVALWNRRELSNMQNHRDEPAPEPPLYDEEEAV